MHVDSNPIVDNKLYAFWFDGDNGNIYAVTMDLLYDVEWLRNFFIQHKQDLQYFHISDINTAIERTIDDLDTIDDFFLSNNASLDEFFQNLSLNYQDKVFQRSKGKLCQNQCVFRNSWVRFYAIKLEAGIYILTGGTIKLTERMQDREHTNNQLKKLEECRDFLIDNGFCDFNGFYEYITENI